MAENTDHSQPTDEARQKILKDLETAGLLRLVDKQTVTRREAADKRDGVVLPFRKPAPKAPARKAGPSRFAIVAYILVAALAAWLYLAH